MIENASGDKRNLLCKSDVEALIKCKTEPESVEVRPSNLIVASSFYRRWDEAVVWLWGLRFDRVHNLLPELTPKFSVPPYLVKLEERLFSDRIKRLIDGEVKKLSNEDELELVESRIRELKSAVDIVCLLMLMGKVGGRHAPEVFKFGGEIRNRIRSLMMRECRRLEDSYRQQIHHHQNQLLKLW